MSQNDKEMIEFERCRHAENLEHVKKVLDHAGIPYQMGTTADHFDISTLGSEEEYEAIISIRAGDYRAARDAMEIDSLNSELPDDHYLLTSTDVELADILNKASEWSAFDVAHARRILESRGLDPAAFEENREQMLEKLSQGKPASKTLLFFGWLGAILAA